MTLGFWSTKTCCGQLTDGMHLVLAIDQQNFMTVPVPALKSAGG
jgi:hypothetical protein